MTMSDSQNNNNNNNKMEPKAEAAAAAAARKTPAPFPYEFGGPLGALATTLALPIVVLLLAHWSHVGSVDFTFWQQDIVLKIANQSTSNGQQQHLSSSSSSLSAFWNAVVRSPVLCPGCHDADNENTSVLPFMMGAVIAWFLFQVLLERILPSELIQGSPIQGRKDKNNHPLRLTYRINGHLAFWVTLLVVTCGFPVWHETSQTIQFTSFPIELLYQYYAELAFATIILCFALSFYLYMDSFGASDKILAAGGDSGNPFYDFFIGRELNPRIGKSVAAFDWKEFCELRPGLIGWMLLNMACMKQQYINLGGYVSGSMILINVFQGFYVWDALYQERAILSTMDITTDGFGFMLVFGDLAWVPFTYSLQARYLVHHDPHLSYPALALIVALHIFGYFIFRSANGQKDAFRRNPSDPALSHLQYLQTKRGTKLLTTGWWGMARKINYTGDWIMGLTWCMVCGFESIVPYYYAIYFLVLLIHRSIRDDHMCQAKYGQDWNTYKKMVRYRFIPGVV